MAEQYKQYSHREHVLELPDTYIGSVETADEPRWVYDAVSGKIVHKTVRFNPGLYKTFDELLVNARDALIRSTEAGRIPIKRIDVSASVVDGAFTIVVKNDGDGIPIEQHATEKCYIPELIFGRLLTSSNYNKDEEKIVGGKNGYGAKCLERLTKVPLWNGQIKEAKDICVDDILIGDDGTPRNVLTVTQGTGPLYWVHQAHADSYCVNDQHILTLMMPDHKVIFWNTYKNGWTVLWWDSTTLSIRAKTVCVSHHQQKCPECKQELSGNLKRHYKRVHSNVIPPVNERKTPIKTPEMTEEVIAARKELEDFCLSIDDTNIFDISIQDYLSLNTTTKKRLTGVRGKSVEWSYQDIALDPYLLGLWLGDGFHSGYGYACYGEKDSELITYLEEWAEKNNAFVTKGGKYVYRISSKDNFRKKGSAPLKKLLEQYNLIRNKHIPNEYLINDRQTRLAVLAGIIDTDGSVSRDGTRVTITQGMNHKILAEQIVFLARSLGFCVHSTIKNTSWNHKGEKKEGQAYNINISGLTLSEIPTKLPRKVCANTIIRQTSTNTGYITVEPADIGEYVGITIDSNERFVLNDFTVTHNCTNIFSTKFVVSTRDTRSGQHYTQTWTNNMSVCGKAKVKSDKGKVGFVEIAYTPDLARFKGSAGADGVNLNTDMLEVLHTRVVELAALAGKGVKVTWNGEEVKTDTFEKFIKLFLKGDSEKCLAYERCGDRWEVAAVLTRMLFSDDAGTPEDRHVSFANGINTRKGGKHVETVQRHVLSDICEAAKKKKMDLKPGQIKDSITLFVNATIVNPSFDSQTKETLTTPAAKFGSSVTIPQSFCDKLVKLGILEEAQAILEAKSAKDAKKTDGAKKRTIYGIPKLDDALLAGTARSSECTLILTEGDSAATSAIAGLKVVGRERWGVFPLKGKLLNVKDIGREKFNSNEELTNIKKIVGLEQGKVYKDVSSLRYGRILIMSDQDVDGFHIRGLLMNLFHTEWPSLMKLGFLCSLMTPLVKLTRGSEVLCFYSEAELEAWKDQVGEAASSRYKSKYYKGLGTSTPAEAREWFEQLNDIRYEWDDGTDKAMNLAFNKKMADDRKNWLSTYNPKKSIQFEEDPVTKKRHVGFTRFVNDELIHFSNADNIRSLPSVMDGLKPSQRKILFGCFKRGLRQEVKVAQLAGYVSEHAAYHHGEASLNQTITNMAQVFVGSNNLNLLAPVGQFGSRLMGGKDASSPRYIFTHMEPIVDVIFRKEDAPILNHLEDDGQTVEPDTYLPTIPLLAINGSVGIGTGFSTDIPPHNPKEIVGLLQERVTGARENLAGVELTPYWVGYRGIVEKKGDKQWMARGVYSWNDSNKTVHITELPVGTWTKDYKAFLDSLVVGQGDKSELKTFEDLSNDVDVNFTLYLDSAYYTMAKKNVEDFEKKFRLAASWKTSNMSCFDCEGNIVKYNTVGDMLEEFYMNRLLKYETRRQHWIRALKDQLEELNAKWVFVRAIVEGRLKIVNEEDDVVLAGLKALELPPRSDREHPDTLEAYEYLLRMRVDRIKKRAIIEAEEAVAKAQVELAALEGTTPRAMWKKELEEFLDVWAKHEVKMIEFLSASTETTKPSKKKNVVVRKTTPKLKK